MEAGLFRIHHDLAQAAPVESVTVLGAKAEDGTQISLSKGPGAKPGQDSRGSDIDAPWVDKLLPAIGSQRYLRRPGRVDTA